MTFLYNALVDFLVKVSSVRVEDQYVIKRTSVSERRRLLVNEFVTNWRNNCDMRFFTVLRLILPDKDKGRSYHIKELTLCGMVSTIYGIHKLLEEYRRLFNGDIFKDTGRYRKSHKLAEMIAEIVSARQPEVNEEVSLQDVDDFLEALAHENSKTASEQRNLIGAMFKRLNYQQLKYMILIILKARVIGHSETAILRAWHPDAPSYFSVVTSIEAVCQRLQDPTHRLNSQELSIQVMQPFAPQLAAQPKKSYDHIVKIFGGDFLIEEKLDGERLLTHIEKVDGDFKLKFYSRKGTDYTYAYGESFTTGTLAPHIKEAIGERRLNAIDKLVLDGEVLSYDVKRNVVLPLGTLKSTNIETLFEQTSFRPLYVIFDVLLINDQLVCDKPLIQRRSLLNQLISPKPHYIELIQSEEGHSVENITMALQAAMESNSEGIIVKDKRKKYIVDSRDDSWIKVKPEYLQEFGANVDLCIIGKTPSKKTTYICGLRVGEADRASTAVNTFYSFCRIANGISVSDAQTIESMTYGKWRSFEKDPPPEALLQFAQRIPIEWINPKDSVVLEIKARDVEYGPYGTKYKVGSTLLSGYMKAIRQDKDWKSSMSLEEYLAWKHRFAKHAGDQKIDIKHQRKAKRTHEAANVEVEKKSNLFENYVFYLLSDYKVGKKRVELDELKTTVQEFGGEVTNSEKVSLTGGKRLILIGERNTLKVELLHRDGYDIIRPRWIFDCIKVGELLLLEPRYCYQVSRKVLQFAKHRVDIYGDSFVNPLTVEDLRDIACRHKKILNTSKSEGFYKRVFTGIRVLLVECEDLVSLFFDKGNQFSRNLYLANVIRTNMFYEDKFETLRSLIWENGGQTVASIDESTVIVIPDYMKTAAKEIETAIADAYRQNLSEKLILLRKNLAEKFAKLHNRKGLEGSYKTQRIVSDGFIFDSVKENILVPEEQYPVNI